MIGSIFFTPQMRDVATSDELDQMRTDFFQRLEHDQRTGTARSEYQVTVKGKTAVFTQIGDTWEVTPLP
jgi:hypothetical protein